MQANTKKNLLIYIVCHDNTHHHSVKISFWYLLVLYVNFSVKCLKFAPKWSLSYFQPILAAIFVTIPTVKVKSIPDFYTCAIVLKKTNEKKLVKSNFHFFCLIGGPK